MAMSQQGGSERDREGGDEGCTTAGYTAMKPEQLQIVAGTHIGGPRCLQCQLASRKVCALRICPRLFANSP